MKRKKESVSLTQLNFVLYVLLLIMTPFLLLQNYLQTAIGIASNTLLQVGGVSIPYTLIVGVIVLGILLYYARKSLRLVHLAVIAVILFLFWVGQQLTDYYFNHKFYELQHNWHYIAYSGFAIISWRFWKSLGKTASQTILYTLIFAFSASMLDELAQVPLSNRIFDVCDIAKDIYGVVLGNVFVFFVLDNGRSMPGKLKLTHRTIKGYLQDPLTLLVYEYIFVFIFLSISSIISEREYFPVSLLIPIGIFILLWLMIHLLQNKVSRWVVLSIILLSVAALSISVASNYSKDITYNKYGLTVYKGIPIPFFDVMIFEDGSFRLVDKKHVFNKRDQRTILTKCTDILLIGSGADGLGGRGFSEREPVQFIYNSNTGGMTQIIILRTPEACQVYNRLKKEHKNVTFILHNTC
ncbi:MAG: VanZ family protein [Candidatus Cloacimonetes bacterium]|nr:VanZ family protein [Candidatus Cloacimonadota bacterium]